MEADAAFGRAACITVLHTIAKEHAHAPVVHTHRDLEAKLAERPAQNRPRLLIQLELIGHGVELPLRDIEGIEIDGHYFPPRDAC